MDDTVNIKGLKDLGTFLQQLPLKLEKNILRSALRAGARVIADEAKRNVPVKNGKLKASIRTGSNISKGNVEAYARAGGKSSGKGKDKSAFYAQFVEYGTAAHIIKAGKTKPVLIFTARDGKKIETTQVSHPGAVAKPFLRPALDSKGKQAVEAVNKRIRDRLTDEGINVPAIEGTS